MDFITNALSSLAAITIILGVVAKLLPNEKLQSWGFGLGAAITRTASSKLGKASWEKIEDFFVNSFGVFLGGLKGGLNSDDQPEE